MIHGTSSDSNITHRTRPSSTVGTVGKDTQSFELTNTSPEAPRRPVGCLLSRRQKESPSPSLTITKKQKRKVPKPSLSSIEVNYSEQQESSLESFRDEAQSTSLSSTRTVRIQPRSTRSFLSITGGVTDEVFRGGRRRTTNIAHGHDRRQDTLLTDQDTEHRVPQSFTFHKFQKIPQL